MEDSVPDNREVWKDIEGYGGIYQVSNHGRVRSVDRVLTTKCPKMTGKGYRKMSGKILAGVYNNNGYEMIGTWNNGQHKLHLVHRLVATAFIPNPQNRPCVNHLDENPKNNCVNNLEWVTHKENSNYGTFPERMVKNSTRYTHTYAGKALTLKEWAAVVNIPVSTLYSRLYKGWPVELALTVRPNHGNKVKNNGGLNNG